MASLLDDQYRSQLDWALDSDREALTRLDQLSELVDHLEGLENDLARKALEAHTMREVAEAGRLPLGTAQRRWGHLNPRSRSTT